MVHNHSGFCIVLKQEDGYFSPLEKNLRSRCLSESNKTRIFKSLPKTENVQRHLPGFHLEMALRFRFPREISIFMVYTNFISFGACEILRKMEICTMSNQN